MNYYSEKDIRDIVAGVLAQSGLSASAASDEPAAAERGEPIPVEVSARHVHLTQEALDVLFGKGYCLTPKKELSQPGQFAAEEHVKLVTRKGAMESVSVLGPVRKHVQVELSATDARALGVQLPVRLSGDLDGAGDMLLMGPKGVYEAKACAIIARAHVHMTPEQAARWNVRDGQTLSVQMDTARPVTLDGVIARVSGDAGLAVHIDVDEANAAAVTPDTVGYIVKRG
ncbi:MAG: phosphate propanoyltransferase [Ruminococcaceae bacterium]|nr:phosphate propanoyltransferase [Oscillospiraceae bacterium]